jgi:hypothetical protein
MVRLTYSMLPTEVFNDSMLNAENGDLYKNIVNRVYSAPKAFERIETWRELYEK